MKTNILLIFALPALLFTSCSTRIKTVEEDGGSIVTVKYHDIEKYGETSESILSKLSKRVSKLSDYGKVYYSDIDSTYQINLPEFYSERNVRFLLAKGEVNINMFWIQPEFEKTHGQKLIAMLGKKYKVEKQEVGMIIEDMNIGRIEEIEKYIADNKLLVGFPEETRLYWQAPSLMGRENSIIMYILSSTSDNFNLNKATDSIEFEKVDTRSNQYYTKLYLNQEYTAKYADISDRNVGSLFAISIDQFVVSTPVIESKINTGVITSVAGYDYEGHQIFDALLASDPIKSPKEIISFNVISSRKKGE